MLGVRSIADRISGVGRLCLPLGYRIRDMALMKHVVLLNKDVPRAARFYAHGLGLAVSVCSERWAELRSGPFKIALMQAPRFSSRLFFLRVSFLAFVLSIVSVSFQFRTISRPRGELSEAITSDV